MLYRTVVPPPPLNNYIERFWYYERGDQSHTLERVLPTGTTQMIINLEGDLLWVSDHHTAQCYSGALLHGAYSRSFVIDARQQGSVVGIHFKAGGSFPFFDVPQHELQNQHVPLDALWGVVGRDLPFPAVKPRPLCLGI